MLAVGGVSRARKRYTDQMTTHTAHAGNLATSASSSAREALDSVVWAEMHSAEKHNPAMVKRRMMKRNDQSPKAEFECKRFASGDLSRGTYLGLVYKSSHSDCSPVWYQIYATSRKAQCC